MRTGSEGGRDEEWVKVREAVKDGVWVWSTVGVSGLRGRSGRREQRPWVARPGWVWRAASGYRSQGKCGHRDSRLGWIWVAEECVGIGRA